MYIFFIRINAPNFLFLFKNFFYSRKEVKWSDDVSQSADTTRQISPLSPNLSTASNNSKNLNTFDDFYNLCDKYNNNSSGSSANTMSYGNTGYMNRRRDNQFPTQNAGSNYQSSGKHPVYLLVVLKFS